MIGLIELRSKTTEELIDILLATNGSDRNVKIVLRERKSAEKIKAKPNGHDDNEMRSILSQITNGDMSEVHHVANHMLANSYTGQGLDDEDRAHNYILLAADNPDVESQFNAKAAGFWKAAAFQYQIWLVKKKRGLV